MLPNQALRAFRRFFSAPSAPRPLMNSHAAAGTGTGAGANEDLPGLPISPVALAYEPSASPAADSTHWVAVLLSRSPAACGFALFSWVRGPKPDWSP